MKHPLHYLYKIFLFILIITVSSCEKEELTEEPLSSETTENIQPEVKISSKPLAQFIEEDAKFKRFYGKFTSKRKGIQLKEGSDFEVNPSKVIKVEDSGKTTYTVAITKENTPVGTFDNLVIDVDEDETMQSYILSYIPDANGIVEFTNDSVSFKGTMTVTPVDYDASELLSQRHAFFYITIMYCDVWGTTHLAGSGCTGAYPVTFAIPIGTAGTVASQNNNGITIVGSQSGSSPGFGGGSGSSSTVPVWQNDEDVVERVDAVIKALKLEGVQDKWKRMWLQGQTLQTLRIFTFLAENQFSDESTDFAIEAIDVLMEGGEVDWEDKIIILVDKPCAAGVINDANSLDNEIGQRMKETFDNDKTNYNVIISNDNIQQDNPNMIKIAETYPILNEDGSIKSMNITFDNSYLDLATDISIFATAIHENIHALMFYQLDQMNITVNDPLIDYSILANEWSKAVATRQSDGNLGPSHLEQQMHEIMAGLVSDMANIIKGYADNKGYTISDTQAEALGWAGLQDSVAWAVMDEYLKETYEDIIDYDATSFEILSVGVACH